MAMDKKTGFHMTAEEFRRHGRAVVDWIADYYENIESFPVSLRFNPARFALLSLRTRPYRVKVLRPSLQM